MECLKWKQTKHDKQPTGIVLSQCHRNPNVLLFKQKFFGKGGYRKSYNSCPAMPYRDLVPNSSNLLPLPALPKPGARLDVPSLAGSSDALALAEIAGRNPGKLLAVITASAADAQRLLDEIPWFAPNLRVRLAGLGNAALRPFFTAPGPCLRAPGDLWSTLQGQVDILLVPASTAVNRLAPPEFMAAYTFEFRKAQKLDAEKFRSQVTLAGYAHVTQVVSPGEYSIRGGLIDLFPMGSQLPYRLDLFDDEIESIKTFDVDTQRTVYPVPEVRLLPRANSRWTTRAARISARPSASASKATRPNRAFTRIFPPVSPAPASSTTCRCSSTRPPASSTICRRTPFSPPTAMRRAPLPPSGTTPARATTCCKATRPGRCCRRKSCS
jgi:hypothetical protein